jgi:hypothetical protein
MTFTSRSRRYTLVGRPICPQLLDIVETAHFGAENVHNDVAGIDQNPIGMRQALDANIALAGLLQLHRQLVGNCADMAVGAAGRDDHAVSERGFAIEVDGDDVFRLGVFKLGKDGFQQGSLFGAFGRGRGFRGAFRRSGFLRLCWQG